MNDIDEKYTEGLASIQRARGVHRRNGLYLLLVCVVSGLATPVFPPVIILSVIAFCIYWYSHWKTARMACPRCGEPYGTKWFIPFGVGTGLCESCDLSMETLKKSDKNNIKSHGGEWLE